LEKFDLAGEGGAKNGLHATKGLDPKKNARKNIPNPRKQTQRNGSLKRNPRNFRRNASLHGGTDEKHKRIQERARVKRKSVKTTRPVIKKICGEERSKGEN